MLLLFNIILKVAKKHPVEIKGNLHAWLPEKHDRP
jgi:hypothetical protein